MTLRSLLLVFACSLIFALGWASFVAGEANSREGQEIIDLLEE